MTLIKPGSPVALIPPVDAACVVFDINIDSDGLDYTIQIGPSQEVLSERVPEEVKPLPGAMVADVEWREYQG